MPTGRDIRQSFLDFFGGHGHTRVPSSSLIPAGDPTLFFVNAGMVPFKNVFLGEEFRDYQRAVSAQKCLRVQGKHNDLEEVGRTPRHHTFFEMLGNFSFGDYFKQDAIAYAWELLTKQYGLPADRLVATVFREDDEAAKLWEAHLPADRIFRFDEKDNFWSMGETGPCGPCSEIHYDWHPESGAPLAADVETGRFWEVWNLVFMQYNRDMSGTLTPLKKPCIDTGMGLERLVAVLQGVTSNYATDLFAPLLDTIGTVASTQYGANDTSDISMQVIADHIRATTFLIADGVLPSNEGRGYVLRRIMRRAIRHGKMLGLNTPFFHTIAPVVIDEMGMAFPELAQHQETIVTVITREEEQFFRTLETGLAMLQEAFADATKAKEQTLAGALVFKLYDTYGFPKDLTQDIATEAGFAVDHAGFEAAMETQREKARSAWKGSATVSPCYQAVADRGIATTFCGDTQESCVSAVVALIQAGKSVDAIEAGAQGEIICESTPFYGESGGQVGDTGVALGEGIHVTVTDTRKPLPTLFVHEATVTKGTVRVGDPLTLAIDVDRRSQIRKHHSATHLLHKALRETLGEHVKQAGSLVAPDRLRFDFSHFAPVDTDALTEIERDVNRVIRENLAVNISEQPKEAAMAKGAMAFFGDKYGDRVRVVEMGDYSMELCGGSHVNATGDIGLLKVVQETGVAAGVRRIEAVVGETAFAHYQRVVHEQGEIAGLLKVGPDQLTTRVTQLTEQVKRLERELRSSKVSAVSGQDLMAQVEEIAETRVLAAMIEGLDHKDLRDLGDRYRQKIGSGIVALGTVADDRAHVIVMVTKDLTKQFQAGKLIQPIVAALDGKGGGRPDMAQGGGPKTEALQDAIATIKAAVQD